MDKVFPLYQYNLAFDAYMPHPLDKDFIYQSEGLLIHIQKRHPEALKYIDRISEIIAAPDYIGINPNENNPSFELVKIFDDNIQIGIKLDTEKDYLFVATLHPITSSKIQHRLKSGRLKRLCEIDK